MTGYDFVKNARFKHHDVVYEVRQVNGDGGVVCERSDSGEVKVFSRQTLLSSYIEKNVIFLDKEPAEPIRRDYALPVEELKEHVKAELNRRLQYVSAILDESPTVWTPNTLLPIAASVAERIGDSNSPSFSTLYEWIRRFKRTETMRSLVPRYDRRGPRCSYQNKRIQELFCVAADNVFSMSPQASVKNIRDRLYILIREDNQFRPISEHLRMPSLSTAYRMFQKTPHYERSVWVDGKRIADRKFTMVGAGSVSNRILERVEVDHTPIDLFLIDEKTYMPLGRPTLTMLLDHHSRMPLGYFVGYNAPSTLAVMAALKHAILPKTFTESKNGIKINNEWPCFGTPNALIVDNGLEFHAKTLEHWAFNLGMRIQYCPKREPRFKGSIERYLKTINYSFVHKVSGTSFSKFYQRGDYNSPDHAVMTLTEFKNILEKWFVDIYAQTVHKGIGTTPLEKWSASASICPPRLPKSIDRLVDGMGTPLKRSLRHDGITVYGLRYSGQVLQDIMRKYGEGVRLLVIVDPSDLGSVDVADPDCNETTHSVKSVNYEYANGLSLEQHNMIKAEVREHGRTVSDIHALYQAKHEVYEKVNELINSRKHSRRRRGARLAGIKPSSFVDKKDASTESLVKSDSRRRAVFASFKLDEVESRPRLSTFRMGSGGNNG